MVIIKQFGWNALAVTLKKFVKQKSDPNLLCQIHAFMFEHACPFILPHSNKYKNALGLAFKLRMIRGL